MVASGGTSYPISEFAVSGMVKVSAMDYEKEGLVAIAVNPGDIPTILSCKLLGKANTINQSR